MALSCLRVRPHAPWRPVSPKGWRWGLIPLPATNPRRRSPPTRKSCFLPQPREKNGVKLAAESARDLAESVNAARELINIPGSDLTPENLAKQAKKVAKRAGLSIEILDENQLKKQGYNGLLTVGRGAEIRLA